MSEDKIINYPLEIPFKDFMPGQVIQSGQFNDDMAEIEEKVNEVVEKHNTLTNETDNHISNKDNPHEVTAKQVGTYSEEEIDAYLEDIRNGGLYDKSIENRVLDDECVESHNIKNGSITSIKVDSNFGSQINISKNIDITDRYTKAEVNDLLTQKVGEGTYSKEELDQMFEDVQAGQIVDGTIDVSKLKDNVGKNLDISVNPSILDRYTKAEVNVLIQENGLPRDWGGLEEIVQRQHYGHLPVANVMTADEFIAPSTPVLDVDVKEVIEARGGYNALKDRLNELDEKQTTSSSQLEHIARVSTNELQNDINNAVKNNQKLIIKNGRLDIEQIRCEGTGVEKIEIESNLNTIICSSYGSVNNKKGVLHFENLDTVKISNLKMEYTNTNESLFNYHNLLDIRNCKNVIIENCQFDNSLFAGFSVDGCDNVIVRNTKASGNYFGGMKFANSKYVLIDGCNFSENGWSQYQNKGYGVAQEISKVPCDQVIITNSVFNNNVRKGIDCHEFYNATITNNELNGNGIFGIALQNNEHNAGKVIISNNIVENQPSSGYTTEAGIDVSTIGDVTVEEIIISNNIIKNVCCRGIGVAGNGCNNVLISNNIVNGVIVGKGTGACLRVKEVSIPCKTVKVIGNTFTANETANILVEQCEKLFIESNYLDNTGNANGISMHFPNKDGDIEKVPYAVIQGNVIKFSGLYFENGWNLRGTTGAITNNRHSYYTFKDNTVTNSNGTTYQLWEQAWGLRTVTTPTGLPSACSSGDWVVGDKVITSNHISTGYTGKICVESGSPGTWAYFGKIETV